MAAQVPQKLTQTPGLGKQVAVYLCRNFTTGDTVQAGTGPSGLADFTKVTAALWVPLSGGSAEALCGLSAVTLVTVNPAAIANDTGLLVVAGDLA